MGGPSVANDAPPIGWHILQGIGLNHKNYAEQLQNIVLHGAT